MNEKLTGDIALHICATFRLFNQSLKEYKKGILEGK